MTSACSSSPAGTSVSNTVPAATTAPRVWVAMSLTMPACGARSSMLAARARPLASSSARRERWLSAWARSACSCARWFAASSTPAADPPGQALRESPATVCSCAAQVLLLLDALAFALERRELADEPFALQPRGSARPASGRWAPCARASPRPRRRRPAPAQPARAPRPPAPSRRRTRRGWRAAARPPARRRRRCRPPGASAARRRARRRCAAAAAGAPRARPPAPACRPRPRRGRAGSAPAPAARSRPRRRGCRVSPRRPTAGRSAAARRGTSRPSATATMSRRPKYAHNAALASSASRQWSSRRVSGDGAASSPPAPAARARPSHGAAPPPDSTRVVHSIAVAAMSLLVRRGEPGGIAKATVEQTLGGGSCSVNSAGWPRGPGATRSPRERAVAASRPHARRHGRPPSVLRRFAAFAVEVQRGLDQEMRADRRREQHEQRDQQLGEAGVAVPDAEVQRPTRAAPRRRRASSTWSGRAAGDRNRTA